MRPYPPGQGVNRGLETGIVGPISGVVVTPVHVLALSALQAPSALSKKGYPSNRNLLAVYHSTGFGPSRTEVEGGRLPRACSAASRSSAAPPAATRAATATVPSPAGSPPACATAWSALPVVALVSPEQAPPRRYPPRARATATATTLSLPRVLTRACVLPCREQHLGPSSRA